jgi:hypothetical protein
MALQFIGIDPDTPGGNCPSVRLPARMRPIIRSALEAAVDRDRAVR